MSHEPEFRLLSRFVHPGDWALDIGANVGHYTIPLAALVGPEGHVFSFEPIIATSEILSFIVRSTAAMNVSVFNTAVSDKSELLKFSLGRHDSGLPNYFVAKASENGTYGVLGITIDDLALPQRISFVKIDTEGAELAVLHGMEALIERDHPILLIEGDESLQSYLGHFGYRMQERRPKSPNLLFFPPGFTADLN